MSKFIRITQTAHEGIWGHDDYNRDDSVRIYIVKNVVNWYLDKTNDELHIQKKQSSDILQGVIHVEEIEFKA